MLPSARQMGLRATLLIALLVGGLIVGGAAGQLAIWIAGGIGLVWLVREVVIPMRRRRRR